MSAAIATRTPRHRKRTPCTLCGRSAYSQYCYRCGGAKLSWERWIQTVRAVDHARAARISHYRRIVAAGQELFARRP